MKRFTKKVSLLVLVIVMLCSMLLFQSGCGASKENATTPTVQASTATVAATTVVPEQPVELTIMAPTIMEGVQTGLQDDAVTKEIERVTGVTMNIVGVSSGDTNTKIAAMIASNDMSDITYFTTPDLMQNAVTANLLLPLDELIEKYGQDFKKNIPQILGFSKTNLSIGKTGVSDGKTYILGGMPVGKFNALGNWTMGIPWVRWDLYKKLGYPKVDSIDDYIPLMKQLMALEPKTADGKKTYALGANMAEGPWSGDWCVWGSISGVYGNSVNTYASVTDLITNEFINFVGDPDSKFFAAAKFWNQAYREGVLDPESFTMKSSTFVEKQKQGRYLFSMGSMGLEYNFAVLPKGEKEKLFVQLPPPKDTKSVWCGVDQPVGTPTNGVGISQKCKYPEQAMKFLNYLASIDGTLTLLDGVKGQYWDMVDGKPALKAGAYDEYNKDITAFGLKTGVSKYKNMLFMSGFNEIAEYGKYLNMFEYERNNNEPLNPQEQDEVQYYNVKKPLDLVTNQCQVLASAPENALMSAPPQNIADISSAVDKYVYDNFMRMILAKTESAYEAEKTKFLAGVKEVGNDTVVQWNKDERVKALAKYNSAK